MVFSLFSRKDKAESRKPREAVLARALETPAGSRADSRPGFGPETLAAQREAARRTEAKIDQIESEMIAAEAVVRAGNASLPTKPLPATTGAAPAATVEDGTSLVLGDAAGAMAIDVNGPALPGILEEAAILYSNGQAQPAALVLRQALDDPEVAGYQALAWLMLLDLYQCMGDRAGFEALALQYAARFESSPPGWSESLSPRAGGARPAAPAASIAQTDDRTLRLPAQVDATLAAHVERIVASAPAEATIDCSACASIDAAGAQALLALLAHAERARMRLGVRDADRLFSIARAAIEPGRRDPSEAAWMLALQALRMLGRQQDFDDLGIEYCVTYEVSPPSWEPIGDSIRVLAPAEANAVAPEADAAAPAKAVAPAAAGAGATRSARGASQPPAATASRTPANASGAFALRGEVLGRMQDELKALRAFAAGRGDVVVDCRSLRRMEFVAAGDLLNEVATLRSAGRQVLFVEPNYLVYALMLVMGIHDLAEIRRRKV